MSPSLASSLHVLHGHTTPGHHHLLADDTVTSGRPSFLPVCAWSQFSLQQQPKGRLSTLDPLSWDSDLTSPLCALPFKTHLTAPLQGHTQGCTWARWAPPGLCHRARAMLLSTLNEVPSPTKTTHLLPSALPIFLPASFFLFHL